MTGATRERKEPVRMFELFDVDGNGMTDPGEEYLAYRIWEEMCGTGGDEPDPADEEQE